VGMTALSFLPAVLSFLLLGAHFFRGGHLFMTALALAPQGLFFVRRRWAGRTLQILLVVGAAEWCRTLWILSAQRRALGEPWLRMAAILGSVALFAALAALALESRAARRWFAGPQLGEGSPP
jgi:hypothetical protein